MAVSSHDIVPDSPTNVFAAFNPLYKSLGGTPTLTDGNLKAAPNIVQYHTVTSTIGVSSGKWYCEILCLGSPNSANYFGVGDIEELNALSSTQTLIGYSSQGYSIEMQNGAYLRKNNTNSLLTTSLGAFGNGDIFNINMDLDNGNIYFGKNGTYANGGSPVATGLDGTFFIALTMYTNGFSGAVLNTGQDPTFGGNKSPSSTYTDANGYGSFYYDPTQIASDVKALCAANLPSYPDLPIDPALDDLPSDYFKAVTYAGSIGNDQLVDCGFPADLIWIKGRTASYNTAHMVYDTIRGRTSLLQTNNTDAEFDYGNLAPTISTSTTSINGFKTPPTANNNINASANTYVAWFFRAGGAPTTDNTATSGAMTANSVSVDGALQSSYTPSGSPTIYPKRMSVNTKAGFSIVKYTGNYGSNQKIPHGLSKTPDMVIAKALNPSTQYHQWYVYHKNFSANHHSYLSQTQGQVSGGGNYFVTSSFSKSVFAVGGDLYGPNVSGDDYIAYCWHSVAGYSAFGSYASNNSVDGNFIITGFKPAWVMIKAASGSSNSSYWSWTIYDNIRVPYNTSHSPLYANYAVSENYRGDGTTTTGGNTLYLDFVSNGIKIRNSGTEINGISTTYIYAAFAEQPFKYANAR